VLAGEHIAVRLLLESTCRSTLRGMMITPIMAKIGRWLATQAPGLSIEVDEKAAAKRPFQQEVVHALAVRAHDNAILDW
jgi:hypothetical protein